MENKTIWCWNSPVDADTVPVVPLVTAVAANHPVLLVVRLRWIVLVLTDWTDLKKGRYKILSTDDLVKIHISLPLDPLQSWRDHP